MKYTEVWRTVKNRDARAGGFNGRAADVSFLRVVLLFRASASAIPPSEPSLLLSSLRTRRRQGEKGRCTVSVHAVGPQGMGRWVRWQGSRLERLEGGIALQGLGERHATLGAEVVVAEAAHTAKAGGKGRCSERACAVGPQGMGGWVRWQVDLMAGQQT